MVGAIRKSLADIRGQSNVVGSILLVAIVLVVVVGFGAATFPNYATDNSDPNVDIEVADVTANEVEIAHTQGDSLNADEVEVRVDSESSYVSDSERYDDTDSFDQGDSVFRTHFVDEGDAVEVMVIDEVTNTVLLDTEELVPEAEPSALSVSIDAVSEEVYIDEDAVEDDTELVGIDHIGDEAELEYTVKNEGGQPVTIESEDLRLEVGTGGYEAYTNINDPTTLEGYTESGDAHVESDTIDDWDLTGAQQQGVANTDETNVALFANGVSDDAEITVYGGPHFDPEIQNTTETINATETFEFEANVTNDGDLPDTQTINATLYDLDNQTVVDSVLDEKTLSLDPGEHDTADFENDAGLEIPEYGHETRLQVNVTTHNAEVEDGYETETIDVNAPPSFTVDLNDAPEAIEVGEVATMNATVENIGDNPGEQTVSLDVPDADPETAEEETIELAAGESTDVSLDIEFTPEDVGTVDVAVQSEDSTEQASGVTVYEPMAVELEEPAPVFAEEEATITATVTNPNEHAAQSEALTLWLGDDDEENDPAEVWNGTVEVDAGEETTVSKAHIPGKEEVRDVPVDAELEHGGEDSTELHVENLYVGFDGISDTDTSGLLSGDGARVEAPVVYDSTISVTVEEVRIDNVEHADPLRVSQHSFDGDATLKFGDQEVMERDWFDEGIYVGETEEIANFDLPAVENELADSIVFNRFADDRWGIADFWVAHDMRGANYDFTLIGESEDLTDVDGDPRDIERSITVNVPTGDEVPTEDDLEERAEDLEAAYETVSENDDELDDDQQEAVDDVGDYVEVVDDEIDAAENENDRVGVQNDINANHAVLEEAYDDIDCDWYQVFGWTCGDI